jgi:hypothetical protein
MSFKCGNLNLPQFLCIVFRSLTEKIAFKASLTRFFILMALDLRYIIKVLF